MNRLFSQQGVAFPVVIVLVALAAGVLGGGAYFWQQSGEMASGVSPTPSVDASPSPSPTPAEIMTTLPELVGRGQSLECDWRMPTESSETPFQIGKLWTMNNQGRSTINATLAGQSMEMNAIYKDGTAYVWLNLPIGTMGYQFDPANLAETELTDEQKRQAEQLRSQMIFDCKDWTPDASMFDLPEGVDFKKV